MPQSKLNSDGYTSSLKLNAGKYANVRKRVHNDVDLAMGLSAVENAAVGPGNERRNWMIVVNASPIMLIDRMRCWKNPKDENEC